MRAQVPGTPRQLAQVRMPLTPPPIAPQPGRVGPVFLQPTPTLTATAAITSPGEVVAPPTALTATSTLTTATALPREVVVVTATAMFMLPTVTPTPDVLNLLPTPTPTPLNAPDSPGTPAAEITATGNVTPTVPVTDAPTLVAGTAATGVVTPTAAITAVNAAETLVAQPASPGTTSLLLPPSYVAQGSFASQTVHRDGSIAQQQGSFTIAQNAALNAYAANQHYTLRTLRAGTLADEINVYLVDDYIAVNYTGGDWTLARRDQGSNIVRAIQPFTDLAVTFPRIISQAEFVGQEAVAGDPALRYRIADPRADGARTIQRLFALTGEIRSLKLEVWVSVASGYVVAYEFQVELTGARVLNSAGAEERADQAVTWTYQLAPVAAPEPIRWPADAPTPTSFPVAGFAAGDFPVPPNTELLTLVAGIPDLVSTQSLVAVDSFYRTELAARGWTVTGEGGVLRCSKEGITLQLLIIEDAATGGTRISVLPEP